VYTPDQSIIAAHADSPDGLVDVITFVITTVNQRFHYVGNILETVHTQGLDACKALTGSQKRGIAFCVMHARELRTELRCGSVLHCLRQLIEIPHIGIVKAGFILQLVRGEVGCLDRHNLRAAGIHERAFNSVPQSTEGLTLKLRTYIGLCTQLGTPAHLWDTWCALIARKYPQHFPDAQAVSWAHVEWCRASGA
jgi:hypothetical protein